MAFCSPASGFLWGLVVDVLPPAGMHLRLRMLWLQLVVWALLAVTALGADAAEAKYEFLEELPDADAFEKRVTNIANGTDGGSYAPVVLFHMPWCKHCRATIPELAQAAENINRALGESWTRQNPHIPKFFMLSCEAPGAKAVCDIHAGTNFPTILLFRDRRAVKFDRPRTSQVLTWWVHRVSRSAVPFLHSMDQLQSYTQHETTFVMSVEQKDSNAAEIWQDIALDYLDKYFFLFTTSDKDIGKQFGPVPALTVRGPPHLELSPLPFSASVDRSSVEEWVKYNAFAAVTMMSPHLFFELKTSGFPVVALVYGGKHKKKIKQWKEKVAELRPQGKYLYAAINASDEESAELFKQYFPLLSPTVTSLPRIFVFAGNKKSTRYWEDPELSNISSLTLTDINALLESAEALQEHTVPHWFKEKRKIYIRFATRSLTSAVISIMMPLCAVGFLVMCCKTICAGDEEDIDDAKPAEKEKHSHVD